MTVTDPRQLRAVLDLGRIVDELIEQSLRDRESLVDAAARILPVVCKRVGARGAFLRTYSEDLTLTTFPWPAGLTVPEAALARTGVERRERLAEVVGDELVVAVPLDVAGEWFGAAGLVVDPAASEAATPAFLTEQLLAVAEELDNYLHAIRAARERHRLLMQLGDALRHRVLREGLSEAVAALSAAVPVERLLVTCVAEEGRTSTLHVEVYERGRLVYVTMGEAPPRDAAVVAAEARAYLRDGAPALAERFGFRGAREEVLINGVTHASVVGKVLAVSRGSGFNTTDRELLAGFAGFVRQRIVDFNKEWRTLARSFRPEDVARLLAHSDYVERFLAPREAEVAILFVDICGFTRLSEQILKTPAAVAELVEKWSRETVDLLWKHGGVFDKMVGDCVIGLFGPPFFEATPGERLATALRCAAEIRAMTQGLPARLNLPQLRESGLDVSTGVNLAPLFVGQFGPNDNFTGFSSGMNNAARLQGCAGHGEILVMADPIARLPEAHGLSFGAERSAKVKNVAEPLRFRPLL